MGGAETQNTKVFLASIKNASSLLKQEWQTRSTDY